MRTKGAIYLIVIIIAGVYALISTGVNNLVGCNDKLLSRFEDLELANAYQDFYVYQLQNENPNFIINNYGWYIEKYSDNCKVEFRVSGKDSRSIKSTVYLGDEFLVNKKEGRVYALSEGAREFLDLTNFSDQLP